MRNLSSLHKACKKIATNVAAWRRAGIVACPAQPQTKLANVNMKLAKTFL